MKTIDPLDSHFDLNLLRVLTALAHTRNVTNAALALGMSQSGFSTALSRLRRRVGDVLFVRTPAGMAPTPRAQKMILVAQAVLAQVSEGVLEQPLFDPLTSQTEFRLAMADVAEVVYLPRLIQHFSVHAPHVRVTSNYLEPEALQAAMAAGSIDLAIGYYPDLHSQAFFKQRLYTHTYACLMRRGHPLDGKPMTERDYVQWGHASVASPARSNELLERFLEKRGIQRRIVLRTPHHLSLPGIVEGTDLLATVPLAAGVRFAREGGIRLQRLPFNPPEFAVQQHWHRLVHKDVRNMWLRRQIASLFDEGSDEWLGIGQALYGTEKAAGHKASKRNARKPGIGG